MVRMERRDFLVHRSKSLPLPYRCHVHVHVHVDLSKPRKKSHHVKIFKSHVQLHVYVYMVTANLTPLVPYTYLYTTRAMYVHVPYLFGLRRGFSVSPLLQSLSAFP